MVLNIFSKSFLFIPILSLLLSSCVGVSKNARSNDFAGKVVSNPVSSHKIILTGQERQFLSLDIGSPQKDTIIFYFAGSGCRDNYPLLNPLYGSLQLNARLIALTKKGVGPRSTGKICTDKFVNNDNLDNLVADASVLMKQLLQQQGYKNIVVAGHSEGGDIIWRLAEAVPAITHVFSMHRGLGLNNLDELKVIATTKRGQQRRTYNQLISDLGRKSNFYSNDDFILIRKKQSWQVSVRDKRNPARVLLNTGKKVLIMMGDKDKHVPIRSMYATNKVYCDNGSDNLVAIVKKGYGHSIDVNTPERVAELDILARWISGETIELVPPFQRLSCRN